MNKQLQHFLVCLGLISLFGVILDFGIMGGWNLSAEMLVLAWASILIVYAVSYWLAYWLLRVKLHS